MSLKTELQDKLKEIGYELGPFASKDTLSVVLCLHSVVMADKNINVAKLTDVSLRKQLIQHGLLVGPVTNHTRAIYQRKLLELLTHRTTEGREDESGTDEPIRPSEYDNTTKNSLYPDLFQPKTNSDMKKDEPRVLRNRYETTKDSSIRNTYRREPSEIRSQLSTKSEDKSMNGKIQVATKDSGTFLYAGIAVFVALIVFFGYFWLDK